MNPDLLYYIWATVLVLAVALSWVATLFTLPGNWAIVALAALFAFLIPEESHRGFGWTVVGILAGLATLGEIVELLAGAAGAAKQGGSRRGMILAILGAFIGSISGAIIGVPVPVVGSLIAALAGAALGAFGGAYMGETWNGRSSEDSISIGRAALVGRILGTVGKLIVGAVMVVIVVLNVYL